MPLSGSLFTNGTNYLSVANYTGNPAAFSVSCWVWPLVTQTSKVFFSNFLNDGTNRGWACGISDTSSNVIKFYLGGNTLGQSGTLTNNTWAHAVFTWDGTTAKLYLDGNTTPNATLTSGVNYGTVPTNNYIGSLDGSRQQWDGRLAGVGYWSKALSTAEVTSLYNSGAGCSYADLSGTLLTSLVSYHDFPSYPGLGSDSTGNGHGMAGTGSPSWSDGPSYTPAAYRGRTQWAGRRSPRGRWAPFLARSITCPDHGVASVRDEVSGATLPTVGTLGWSRGPWGPALHPNDATGQGTPNLGNPIATGATQFTLAALASTDTTTGGGSGDRHLWAAEGANADMRLLISSGAVQFQLGSDGTRPNLIATIPPIGQPTLITARLTPDGTRSLWYGATKVAEGKDSGAAWGTFGSTLGLGNSTGNATRNWSGLVFGGYASPLAWPDAMVSLLGEDFYAPVRSPRMSPASFGAGQLPATRHLLSLLGCGN